MLGLLLLALGLLLAGAAAAAGVAAAAVSQLELTRWVSYKLRGAAGAADVLQNPGRVLATANALTTLGTLAAAAALPALFVGTSPPMLGALTVAVAVPVVVSAAFLVPRVVGRRWAEPIVARAVARLEQLGKALAPFIPVRDPSKRTTLAAVLTSADTEALASADEIAVVSGVLAFADRPVKELMTPRTSIVALPEGLLAAEAAHVCMQAGYSRYPVSRGSLDEIVGVVHAFDLLTLSPDAPVPVRPALVVPGTTRAADLMLEMQRGRGLLAVVLDEFGGTAGLVTFEDLLRDLVSEIFEPEGPPPSAAAPLRIAELEGSAPASQLAEALGVTPAALGPGAPVAAGAQTVGGLLVQALGRIPRPGERFAFRGLEFDILAASATRVERVAVRPGPVRTVALDRAAERAGGSGPAGVMLHDA
ncbi:MAG TPA: CBS domain-containing protein [Gemmatimonadales bacterium]|nr:CBS domain-containing protein [Gemmatimonadales bacterium]